MFFFFFFPTDIIAHNDTSLKPDGIQTISTKKQEQENICGPSRNLSQPSHLTSITRKAASLEL